MNLHETFRFYISTRFNSILFVILFAGAMHFFLYGIYADKII